MMRALILLFLALALHSEASARDWQIHFQPDTCAVSSVYSQGPRSTTLVFLRLTDGHRMMLINDGWSIEEDKPYPVGIRFDDGKYFTDIAIGGKSGALLFALSDEQTLAMKQRSEVVIALRYEDRDPRILEIFDLSGSTDAFEQLAACIQIIEREKRRAEIISPDPFKN